MTPKSKKYTPPPDAIYRIGKLKQRVSVAISALRALERDLAESKNFSDLKRAAADTRVEIERYRKALNEV